MTTHLPPQRGRWMDRHSKYGCLTASSFGTALGLKGKIFHYLDYCRNVLGTEDAFRGNVFTFHGHRTEDVSKVIYERLIGGVEVEDGGFAICPQYPRNLACSPDGIVSRWPSNDNNNNNNNNNADAAVTPSSSRASSSSPPTFSQINEKEFRLEQRNSTQVHIEEDMEQFQKEEEELKKKQNEKGEEEEEEEEELKRKQNEKGEEEEGEQPFPDPFQQPGAPRRLLEIKSPIYGLYDNARTQDQTCHGIPKAYMCQMQAQIFFSGAEECDFFAFVARWQPEIALWRVKRCQEMYDWMLPKLIQFCEWLAVPKEVETKELIPLDFTFPGFDFSKVEVEPLVPPTNIFTHSPLQDVKRFSFFFEHQMDLKSNSVKLVSKVLPPPEVQDPLVQLLACGNLREGDWVLWRPWILCAECASSVASPSLTPVPRRKEDGDDLLEDDNSGENKKKKNNKKKQQSKGRKSKQQPRHACICCGYEGETGTLTSCGLSSSSSSSLNNDKSTSTVVLSSCGLGNNNNHNHRNTSLNVSQIFSPVVGKNKMMINNEKTKKRKKHSRKTSLKQQNHHDDDNADDQHYLNNNNSNNNCYLQVENADEDEDEEGKDEEGEEEEDYEDDDSEDYYDDLVVDEYPPQIVRVRRINGATGFIEAEVHKIFCDEMTAAASAATMMIEEEDARCCYCDVDERDVQILLSQVLSQAEKSCVSAASISQVVSQHNNVNNNNNNNNNNNQFLFNNTSSNQNQGNNSKSTTIVSGTASPFHNAFLSQQQNQHLHTVYHFPQQQNNNNSSSTKDNNNNADEDDEEEEMENVFGKNAPIPTYHRKKSSHSSSSSSSSTTTNNNSSSKNSNKSKKDKKFQRQREHEKGYERETIYLNPSIDQVTVIRRRGRPTKDELQYWPEYNHQKNKEKKKEQEEQGDGDDEEFLLSTTAAESYFTPRSICLIRRLWTNPFSVLLKSSNCSSQKCLARSLSDLRKIIGGNLLLVPPRCGAALWHLTSVLSSDEADKRVCSQSGQTLTDEEQRTRRRRQQQQQSNTSTSASGSLRAQNDGTSSSNNNTNDKNNNQMKSNNSPRGWVTDSFQISSLCHRMFLRAIRAAGSIKNFALTNAVCSIMTMRAFKTILNSGVAGGRRRASPLVPPPTAKLLEQLFTSQIDENYDDEEQVRQVYASIQASLAPDNNNQDGEEVNNNNNNNKEPKRRMVMGAETQQELDLQQQRQEEYQQQQQQPPQQESKEEKGQQQQDQNQQQKKQEETAKPKEEFNVWKSLVWIVCSENEGDGDFPDIYEHAVAAAQRSVFATEGEEGGVEKKQQEQEEEERKPPWIWFVNCT